MDELKKLDELIVATRRRTWFYVALLAFAFVLFFVANHYSPYAWQVLIFAGYVAIPLFGLVVNCLLYTDLRLDRFELTPMCPVRDMMMLDHGADAVEETDEPE